MKTKRLLMIAFAVTITFVQEQMFLILPQVQLTIVLMFVFASILTYKESFMYITVYVILDNLYLGGFNPLNAIPMFIMWNTIPYIYNIVLRRTEDEAKIAKAAFVFGFLYSWSFIPGAILLYGFGNVWQYYILADIPWEIALAVVGYVSVLWAYKPLVNIVKQLDQQTTLSRQKAYE
ncbi:hypothetical protein [Candidatus Xianfuyuplasma coldseepsis]|uniref:Rod shape-determining protein MreD n=1 Tax=Candidatus Xianfuyuplasma coldseepsis TaxID=2782163 RepID=A0A7L7KS69_9MOLU|nr:hypothetical protein [Xianfuyuplasma coldseepsis]QMS85445.1 hypothetical protein G4Z02_06645 [Xianfuyuplasma coldseepsis]